eukprot:6457783-Amphidinium_carterae.1
MVVTGVFASSKNEIHVTVDWSENGLGPATSNLRKKGVQQEFSAYVAWRHEADYTSCRAMGCCYDGSAPTGTPSCFCGTTTTTTSTCPFQRQTWQVFDNKHRQEN